MRAARPVSPHARLALCVLAACTAFVVHANALKPADDFLEAQPAGSRLIFLGYFGGLRAIYELTQPIEPDMSELKLQLAADANLGFSEVGVNADMRFFLFTLGAAAGYHNDWHLLEFTPDHDGLDDAGQALPALRFSDLHRQTRRAKDDNGDFRTARWEFFEGRVGLVAPAPSFIAVTTAAYRYEDRPDTSFDWSNSTVMNGGFHLRWETLALFRHRKYGFVGPALRILNVPRSTELSRRLPPPGGECRNTTGCEEVRKWEVHYGVVAGLRPHWVHSSEVVLFRAYTMQGYDNGLFGTHAWGISWQLFLGYQLDVDL